MREEKCNQQRNRLVSGRRDLLIEKVALSHDAWPMARSMRTETEGDTLYQRKRIEK